MMDFILFYIPVILYLHVFEKCMLHVHACTVYCTCLCVQETCYMYNSKALFEYITGYQVVHCVQEDCDLSSSSKGSTNKIKKFCSRYVVC